MAQTTVFGAHAIDARRITFWDASAVPLVQKAITIEALADLRSYAHAHDAVVAIFERTDRRTCRRVVDEFVALKAHALLLQTSTISALLIAALRAQAVVHLVADRADAAAVVAAGAILTCFHAALPILNHMLLETLVTPHVLLVIVVTLARVRRDAFTVDAAWVANWLADSAGVGFVALVALT